VSFVSVGPPFVATAGVPLPSGAGEPAMEERGVVSRSFSRLRRLNGCWRLGVSAVFVSFDPFSVMAVTSSLNVGGGPIS